jgi:hypothetical protein
MIRNKTYITEEWKQRAIEVHGDKYNYDKVIYTKHDQKVIIKCNTCNNEFSQIAGSHLCKHGCKICGNKRSKDTIEKYRNNSIKYNKDNLQNRKNIFIEKSKIIHNNFYTYEKVNFIDSRNKVIITCPKHGDFLQSPTLHSSGQKCRKCWLEKLKNEQRYTQDDWLKKCISIHGDKYNYNKVKYVDCDTKVIIVCPIHGDFLQKAKRHSGGAICPKCKLLKKGHTTETWIKKAESIHGDKCLYTKTIYVDSKTPLTIICKKHQQEFQQNPSRHFATKNPCPRCCAVESNKIKYPNRYEKWLEKCKIVHGDKYNYNKVKYINTNIPVIITCPKHGDFEQKPSKHSYGHNCPKCNNSHGEKVIAKWLESENIIHIRQAKFDGCNSLKGNKLKFDFYLPNHNICIEFDGSQHSNKDFFICKSIDIKAFNLLQIHDRIKNKFCFDNGIKLIRIPYTENINQRLNKEFNINKEMII